MDWKTREAGYENRYRDVKALRWDVKKANLSLAASLKIGARLGGNQAFLPFRINL